MNMDMNESVLIKNIGSRLKQTRESLGHTLKEMQEITGVSLSYISDFERGKKFPSTKYLKEMVLQLKVSSDYILTGEGEMFIIPESDDKPSVDFGRFSPEVDELLYYMKHIPNTLFAVLHFFSDYKVQHEDFLRKFLEKLKKQKFAGDENSHES